MPRHTRSTLPLLLVIGLIAQPVLATCGGGGGGGTGGIGSSLGDRSSSYTLPWMVAGADVRSGPPNADLVLYWFPTSRDQALASELLESRTLISYASRCLAFALITSQNEYLSEQFDAVGRKPLALLATGNGEVIHAVESNGASELHRKDVEKLVKTEFKAREEHVKRQLSNAKEKVKSGSTEDAIALYQGVAAQRCMFPDRAKDAAKQLRKLGVDVAAIPAGAPMNVSEAMNHDMVALMREGVEAEQAGDYVAAQKAYERARRLDSADPVPLRYLGELYRHHTGQWDKATATFKALLATPADAVSRAVALHGLGKMTIHSGEFEAGLAMIEESITVFPLALAYRNLAVYWNSEEDFDKAYGYAQKALALDPTDPYNIVFAATYLVGKGERDRALRIAADNADLLAGSYNLAAIHALAGDRDEALRLLRRHFFEYETNDEVRSKEMWEAREDFVFASLMQDPEFQALTALADQYQATATMK